MMSSQMTLNLRVLSLLVMVVAVGSVLLKGEGRNVLNEDQVSEMALEIVWWNVGNLNLETANSSRLLTIHPSHLTGHPMSPRKKLKINK